MSLALFELACVVIVVATLGAMACRRGWRDLLADYAILAGASWIGEESCVGLYRFYAYAEAWHAHVHLVPLLVPLIWPLVILSARDVAARLWPGSGAIAAGALVAFDASLVEVVAVRAHLWRWSEPGHLHVPLIGILGWGYFAWGVGLARGRALRLLSGPLAAHALILASWWALFRWELRGDLGSWGFALLAIASLVFVARALRARREGRVMPPSLWLPRVFAAGLFVVLLGVTAPTDGALWLHTLLVAAPYLVATGLAPRAPNDVRGFA